MRFLMFARVVDIFDVLMQEILEVVEELVIEAQDAAQSLDEGYSNDAQEVSADLGHLSGIPFLRLFILEVFYEVGENMVFF